MGFIEVAVKKGEKSATEQYDFGDNLKSMVEKFNDDVVFTNARANMKVTLQAGLRGCLDKSLSTSEYAAKFIPGVQTAAAAADPVASMKVKFATMDKEERKAFLASLKDL